jgi:hypothetical protein
MTQITTAYRQEQGRPVGLPVTGWIGRDVAQVAREWLRVHPGHVLVVAWL